LILAIMNWQKTEKGQTDVPATGETTGPQFMTSAEKANLLVSDDIRAQVLSRNASGAPAVYKVIKTDADIIIDSAKIAPISPRLVEAAK